LCLVTLFALARSPQRGVNDFTARLDGLHETRGMIVRGLLFTTISIITLLHGGSSLLAANSSCAFFRFITTT